ncbi:L,D-transpeptidase [Jiella sp. M17.18]|uniref:L,D-transpeptidase family protein n=1 Tax=Jiella sp. M17.18 TaxID=3234247 RepID=UPI0034DE8FDA
MQRKIGRIVVRRAPGRASRGILAAGLLRVPCAIGRSGTSIVKREGDGATPVASMAVLSAWHRPGRMVRPQARLPIRRIRQDFDGWCDAPQHAAYNRHVRLPFPASAESLARADRLYDFVVVLDWNIRSRARGRGSAIFLHIAKEDYPPTAGCVAVAPKDMLRLAPLLRRGSRVVVLR